MQAAEYNNKPHTQRQNQQKINVIDVACNENVECMLTFDQKTTKITADQQEPKRNNKKKAGLK